MNHDIGSLIPELGEWNDGEGISIYAWITGIGRYDHALGYSAIFWPEFGCYEDCVFRRVPSPEAYQDWMRKLGGDTSKVEAVINHLHLVDLFPGSEYKPTKPLLLRLGKILKDTWSSKLAKDFPDRRFEIELTEDADDMAGIEITFFQRRVKR